MKASKEFAQGIEKLVTQANREMAQDAAKAARSNKTAKVPAFRCATGRHVQQYNMDSQ